MRLNYEYTDNLYLREISQRKTLSKNWTGELNATNIKKFTLTSVTLRTSQPANNAYIFTTSNEDMIITNRKTPGILIYLFIAVAIFPTFLELET